MVNDILNPRTVDRHATILRCATDLFAANGFSETTMDDIAEAAAITKRTLYRYVSSKEHLLAEISGKFGRTLLEHPPIDLKDPVLRLEKLIERHVQIVTEQTSEIGVFFDDRKFLPRELQADISRRRKAYESIMANVITEGQRAGLIVPIDAELAGRVLLGAITEIYRWYDPDGRLTPSEIASATIDIFLFGVCAQPPPMSMIEQAVQEGNYPPQPLTPAVSPSDKLREAAVQSFAAMGYRAASIRELSSAAGITNGAVMYHAGYKHSLLEEIHATVFEDGFNIFDRPLAMGGSPTALLARLLGTQMSFLRDHILEIAVVNENIKFLEPPAYRRINKLRSRFINVFSAVVEDGVAAGEFVTPDSKLLARILVGMVNAPYRWYRSVGSDPKATASALDLAIILARLVLFGLSSLDRVASRQRISELEGEGS